MLSHKQSVINALARTGSGVVYDASAIPPDRWEVFPAGCMSSLREVLQHLIACENWWLENIGVPEGERFPCPELAAVESAEGMTGIFAAARQHLLKAVEGLPDSFFDNPAPACRYDDLGTGADLLHYAAEHTFYHDGQIQMLETAFMSQ